MLEKCYVRIRMNKYIQKWVQGKWLTLNDLQIPLLMNFFHQILKHKNITLFRSRGYIKINLQSPYPLLCKLNNIFMSVPVLSMPFSSLSFDLNPPLDLKPSENPSPVRKKKTLPVSVLLFNAIEIHSE